LGVGYACSNCITHAQSGSDVASIGPPQVDLWQRVPAKRLRELATVVGIVAEHPLQYCGHMS
jgi:hypothetical protein